MATKSKVKNPDHALASVAAKQALFDLNVAKKKKATQKAKTLKCFNDLTRMQKAVEAQEVKNSEACELFLDAESAEANAVSELADARQALKDTPEFVSEDY